MPEETKTVRYVETKHTVAGDYTTEIVMRITPAPMGVVNELNEGLGKFLMEFAGKHAEK